MSAILADDSWGKCGMRLIRLVKRASDPETYDLYDLDVTTTLHGDTEDVYRLGDNGKVLTTDAQKNAVYARAKDRPFDDVVGFAADLARYFVDSHEWVTRADVTVERRAWQRAVHAGAPAPSSFVGGSDSRVTTHVQAVSDHLTVEHGARGLRLFNAVGSEFTGFPRDQYTTGNGTTRRILATELEAHWRYAQDAACDDTFADAVLATVVETFGTTYSKSIQYTMLTIAETVFKAHPKVEQIALRLPNLHHYPVDLSAFGLENDHEVFVSSPDPHSLIEATFTRRSGRSRPGA